MIGRYSTGSRKVAIAIKFDKDEGESTVLVDPALDYEKTDLAKYEESYYDDQYLTICDNDQPTWFHIQPMTHKQRTHVGGLDGYDKFLMALRFGLTGVDNYYHQNVTTGEKDFVPPVKRGNYSGMGGAVTEAWLKEADFFTDLVLSLGIMVMRISEASSPLSRGSKQPSGDEV